MKIMVLGAGSFGVTLANIVAENKHNVILWDYQESSAQKLRQTRENPYIKGAKINNDIEITSDLNKILDVEVVVVVVPSFALRDLAQKINKILNNQMDFVIATKGLEAATMASGYQIFQEEVKKLKNISILSGPTHAEELAFKKFTAIVSTSKDLVFAQKIQKTFNTGYLRVYTNTDVNGVEILGAAKNVLAIAAGFCDSHEKLGDNAKAAILTRGLRELRILGVLEGCDSETFYGLTGLGDLIVTATSKHSRNRKFGELLGKGLTPDEAQKEVNMVVEGMYSVKAIHKLKEKHNLELPIIESIYSVLFLDKDIKNVLNTICSRKLKGEADSDGII